MNIDDFHVDQSDGSQLDLTGLNPELNIVCGSPDARRAAHLFLTDMLAGEYDPADGDDGSVLLSDSDGNHRLRTGDHHRLIPASPKNTFSIDFADGRSTSRVGITWVATDQSRAVERQRAITELLARRDQLTDKVQKQRDAGRRSSQQLRARLEQLDREALEHSEKLADARNQLQRIDQQLAESAISDNSRFVRQQPSAPDDHIGSTETDRYRQILRDLEERQQAIDEELSRTDAPAGAQSILKRQRAGLNETETLLHELKAEISRLAESGRQGTCVCSDAGQRLLPLVELLDGQVYSFCAMLGKQQRRVRRRLLTHERIRLARCQAEIHEHLELLRRADADPSISLDHDAWAQRDADYCTCEGHEHFRGCTDANRDRTKLENEQERLIAWIGELERSLAQIEHQREGLQQQRDQLENDATLSGMQRELLLLQQQIDASEHENTRSMVEIDYSALASCALRDGGWNGNDRISTLQALAYSGSRLPLLINNPFEGHSDSETAALLRELRGISRDGGRQILIFTDEAQIRRQDITGISVQRLTLSPSRHSLTKSAPAAQPHREDVGVAVIRPHRSSADGIPSEFETPQSTTSPFANVLDLTPEDEAILAACGIFSPQQLADADTDRLYADVRRFLASDRGRRYQRLGRRYDRSQIRSWIFRARRNGLPDRRESSGQSQRPARSSHRESPQTGRRRKHSRTRTPRQGRSSRPTESRRDGESNRAEVSRALPPAAEPMKAESRQPAAQSEHGPTLRHYLNKSDPVVDAPAIGPKMAERLKPLGIITVDDLLRADADQVADRLQHRATSADTVRQWQKQSRLVCSIPQIRGHDAQILVACDITEPQELSQMNPPHLLSIVGPFAGTKEGKRIIRGGQRPDLEEVTDWINWAKQSRDMRAA